MLKGITVQALTVHADCWCSWLNYKCGHLLWESRKEIQEIHGNYTQHIQEDCKSRSAPLYLPAVIYPYVMGYITPFLMHIWELGKQFSEDECYCSSSSVGIERHQCCLELETVVWKAALEREAAVHWPCASIVVSLRSRAANISVLPLLFSYKDTITHTLESYTSTNWQCYFTRILTLKELD